MSDIDIEKCRITHYPSEVLSSQAKPIEKIDDNTRRLVAKMTDIMLKHKGCGLAGPQAGVAMRIFIISLGTTRENVKVFINPTVTQTGDLVANEEGCLSVPGIFEDVFYDRCLRAFEGGQDVTITTTGAMGAGMEAEAFDGEFVASGHKEVITSRAEWEFTHREEVGRLVVIEEWH